MDEINRKLEEILNDPESMNKVRLMAESLLGEEEQTESAQNGDTNENSSGSFDAADISRIINIIGSMENRKDDSRARLLLALKPHLTQKRRSRVDSAVKLLKLIEALPLLKEAGILDFGG